MVSVLVSLLKIATILPLIYSQQLVQGNATDASPRSIDTSHPDAGSQRMGSNDLWSMVASMRDPSKSLARMKGGSPTPIKPAKFHWNINLDQRGRYQLNWRVNYAANKILFALEINTSKSNFSVGSDIFALGFSQRGELHSSDYCLIWFDLSHRIHLQDARTNSDNLLELVDASESVCKLLRSQALNQRPSSVALPVASHDEDEDLAEEPEIEHQNSVASNGGSEGTNTTKAGQSSRTKASNDEIFEILFKRPLEVCGERGKSYYAIDNGTTHMVWFTLRGPVLSLDRLNLTELQHESSLSPNAPELRYVGRSSVHFEQGLRRAQLIAVRPSRPAGGGGELELDIRMDKYEVQPVETTYWCKLFKLPERFEARRFHITGYEAVIEAGNEHVVHHMELFNCPTRSFEQLSQLAQLYHSQAGWSGECSAPSRPAATEPCRRVILAWAMGAKPLVYPEQVGQSIGGPGYSPYVVLEVHYNNVDRSRGLVDSSGLRFHYSAELRPFDAGVLEVGLEYTDKNSIPPNMLTPMAGHCVSECTRAAMSGAGSLFSKGGIGGGGGGGTPEDHDNIQADEGVGHQEEEEQEESDSWHNQPRRHRRHRKRRASRAASRRTAADKTVSLSGGDHQDEADQRQPIYIFAAQMHTHLTGVASWTEHVRGGRVLRELQRDDHYSPHFQEIRLLPRPVRVEPGDALVHYCLYDTRARANITLGGHATTDEMCVTYLHYYPKIDLEVCKSSVDTDALGQYFGQLARDENQPTGGQLGDGEKKLAGQAANSGQSPADNGAEDKSAAPRSVSANYHSIDWTPRRARELIEFYASAPLSVQCNRSDGSRWPGNWNGMEPTRLVKWPGRRTEPGEAPNLNYYARPSGRELIAYRGPGHGRKHAQCSRN